MHLEMGTSPFPTVKKGYQLSRPGGGGKIGNLFFTVCSVRRYKNAKAVSVMLLGSCDITIYAPMIYTDPCIMFWMRAYP
jgi:hypothetical protein